MQAPLIHLSQYGRKVYSQFQEDGQLEELIRRLDPPKYFVEIGAGHNGENCTHILLDHGWRGLWLEGNERHADMLKEAVQHPKVSIQHAFVKLENLEWNLRSVPREFGVLSIDVDGNDYWIWKALCGGINPYRPHVVVIESQCQKPLDEPFVAPYDPLYVWDHVSQDTGASPYSMIELGESLGYRFVGMSSETPPLDSPNMFYVRGDLAYLLGG